MAQSASGRKILIVAFIAIVAVAATAWQVIRSIPRARYYTAEGAIITAIDAPSRTAEIEFIHPRDGRVRRLNGTLAPNGQITLNGAPATVDDLKVGDTVTVGGMVGRDLTVAADKVIATRATQNPATAPSTQSTTQPSTPSMKANEP